MEQNDNKNYSIYVPVSNLEKQIKSSEYDELKLLQRKIKYQ
jgi:hypothetical protein